MSPELRRIVGAEAVSNFGSMLSRIAIPWVATLALAADPLDMGVLRVADVAAAALAALLLGTWIDRTGKRRAMLLADVARAAVLGVLAWAAYAGRLSLWWLVAAAAASGVLTAAFELARSAWMAQRIAPDDLPASNARIAGASSVAETAAFALGGWLYQGLGAAMALAIDAVTYVVSALFVKGVRETPVAAKRVPRPARDGEGSGALREVRAGLALVRATPVLRALAVVEVLVALGMSLAATSYMIFVTRELGFGTGLLGVIFAVGGVGALGGAALAPRAARALGRGRAMTLGLVLLAAGNALIPLAFGATWLAAALLVAHQLIGDAGQSAYDVHDRTLRQTLAPPALLARVDAAIRALGYVATLAGALGGGALATWIGERPALGLAAALFGAAAVLAWGRLRGA